jgi:hypothetical protein
VTLEIKQFAPVLIPTLNRHNHFIGCVESLAQCKYADKTELYVALDYPLKVEHWEGYNIINNYLPLIKGFKKVHIIRRKENLGPNRNLLDAISVLFEKHDSQIISEDDNLFSIDFLSFVNLGLGVYAERADIFSISGYQYPIHMPSFYNQEIYVWTGFSAWGVGIWRDKWVNIDWNTENALTSIRMFLKRYNNINQLNKIANHYIPALIHMVRINKLHGDGYISMCLFTKNMYSIFPKVSRVKNLGHDGSGINCRILNKDIYKEQDIYRGHGRYKLHFDIKSNNEINLILKEHFKLSSKSLIKTVFKLLLLNIRKAT